MAVAPEQKVHSMAVKRYLRQVAHAKSLLVDLIRERDEMREMAGTISSPSFDGRVQTSQGNEAAFVHKLDRVFDIEDRITDEINHISDITVDVGRRIEALPSLDERRVLRYRYLDDLPWDLVADKMSISLRTAHRIHAAALEHFELPPDIEQAPPL